jgi:hypothetical protein
VDEGSAVQVHRPGREIAEEPRQACGDEQHTGRATAVRHAEHEQ